MSRRARALAFLLLASVAAALAAGIADGYGSSVAQGYGPLRPVVIAAHRLDGDKPLLAREVSSRLELRRVPSRFVPPGALAAPSEALGLVPVAGIPAGAYLLAGELRPPGRSPSSGPKLGPRRRPVEIGVSGAEALLATGGAPRGTKVDVVVTTEPAGGGRGRTYVAAAGVPLLALGPGADGPGPGGFSAATLGLTKSEALRLIAAESFARKLTLLPEG
jgi:Flp pilus assembly protein CpaB